MKQKPNQPKHNNSQFLKEDFEYIYFKDTQGRLKRLRKKQYQPRDGYIRLRFLEKYYFWWKKKSFDYRNAILPIFMGLSYAYFIYICSMAWSQNELERQIKARLPFNLQNQQLDQMKRLHKQDQKKKRGFSLF